MSRTLYNYMGQELPFRATPDTPPLAATMLAIADVIMQSVICKTAVVNQVLVVLCTLISVIIVRLIG